MSTTDLIIDLEPANVVSIEKQENYVAVLFSEQPVWPRGGRVELLEVHLYDCELRILNARIQSTTVEPPFCAEEWELIYAEGSRRAFLPIGFSVESPVTLHIGPSESPCVIIAGDGASLHLGKQVATFRPSTL